MRVISEDTAAKRAELLDYITELTAKLVETHSLLNRLDESIEVNTFEGYAEAVDTIRGELRSQANKDCEGSHCYGSDEYTREFMVNGKLYLATLKVEYNRHDKTYYYVDSTDFTVTAIDSTN